MLQTPKQENILSSSALVGSAVVCGLVSDGVIGVIPVGTTQQKRIVLGLISLIAMAAVKGKDYTATALKGAFGGMAIFQIAQVVRDFIAAKKPEVSEGMNGNFLRDMVNGGPRGMNSAQMAQIASAMRANGSRNQGQPARAINGSSSVMDLLAG